MLKDKKGYGGDCEDSESRDDDEFGIEIVKMYRPGCVVPSSPWCEQSAQP